MPSSVSDWGGSGMRSERAYPGDAIHQTKPVFKSGFVRGARNLCMSMSMCIENRVFYTYDDEGE